MTDLEKLVREHGMVQIQHQPYEPEHPWTVTLMRSRWLDPGVAHATERVEWWDHAHDRTIERAASQLLRDLEAQP